MRVSAALEWVFFGAVALALVAPGVQAGHALGRGVDLSGTLWFAWWLTEGLPAGASAAHTDLFFHPLGKDVFAHTGGHFLDLLLAAPFVRLFGTPGWLAPWCALVLLANAGALRALARHELEPGPAFLAAVAFQLNPYVLYELGGGRPTQALLAFTPLAFLALLHLGGEGWRGTAWAVGLGLAVALQAWTYWFMGWFLVVGLAAMAPGELRRCPSPARWLARLTLAVCVCGAVVAPAVLPMLRAADAGAVPGLVQGWGSPFAPPATGQVFLGFPGLAPLRVPWVWGFVLVAWTLVGAGRRRWLPVLIACLVFAPGPTLGREGPPLPPYLLAYYAVPFLPRLWFPYRILSVAFVAASVGVGHVAQRAGARWGLVAALLGVGLLASPLAGEVIPLPTTGLRPVPPAYQHVAAQGGAVVTLPVGASQPAIVWQTYHHQPLFGGMGEGAAELWPPGFERRLQTPFGQAMRACGRGREAPALGRRDVEWLLAEGFRWVVLHTETVPPDRRETARRACSDVLGPPAIDDGTVLLWSLEDLGDGAPPEGAPG